MTRTRAALGGSALLATLAVGLASAHAAGGPPPAAAELPRGYVLVANQQSEDASIVALPAGTETRVRVGIGPHEAAIAPDGRWGVVTVYGTKDDVGSRLALVDLAAGTLVRHVSLGSYVRPHAVVPLPGPGRRVLVTSEATHNVVLVDLDADSVVAAIPTGSAGSHMVVATADGRRAFTANIPTGSISEIDLERRTLVRTIPVGQQVTEGIAATPDGREVWIGSNASGVVSVVDTRTGTVVDTIGGFRVPYRLAISADGRLAAIVDPATGALHLVDVATRRTAASLDLGASPRGVVLSPDGRTAFATVVGEGGSGAVVAVDVASRAVIGRFAVGTAPDGLAFQPASEEAAATQAPPADGREVLQRMHDRYAGQWFRTLTFVQRTTHSRPDGTEAVETWYESARAPDRLRIDVGDPAEGNGVLSTPDSMYVVRGGALVRSVASGNELIPFVMGVYTQPVEATVRQLAPARFDWAQVRRDTWRGRPALVVGARSAADSTSPQFWVDEERLVLVRIVLAPPGAPAGAVQDIRFDGYVPLDRSWLATRIDILVGGRTAMREEYTRYEADPVLPDALFDPTRWRAAPHWAADLAKGTR